MTRTAIPALVLLVVAACPSPKPEDTTPVGPAPLAKRISLSWGIQAQKVGGEDAADLYLALEDETGKVASHEVGQWKGTCAVITPSPEMKALSGLRCRTGGAGSELHVVTQGGDTIIVLKMAYAEGAPEDPMAREEVKRISVPLGVAIKVNPIASTTGAPGVR